ncbi:MAG: L,D-transpeptidase family protein [Candidatus Latescibacteria bacterium]|nr:L,D-transpeptidase family protein [Candidatus Latescibacterota bacterium]
MSRSAPVLDTYLRPKIRQTGDHTLIAVAGALLPAAEGLGAFYARHGDHLVWSTAKGPLPVAGSLLRLLREPEVDGLGREGYHLQAIEAAWIGWSRGGGNRRALVRLTELDLLLTNAFMRRAHQLQGQVQPANREWTGGTYADPGALLDCALAAGSVEEVLDRLRPAHPDYLRLCQGLATYQRLEAAGGWEPFAGGERPRRGQDGPAEAALRRRLLAEGDLDSLAGGSGFDAALERALRRFQGRHGLAENGKVDGATEATLAVPAAQRVRQLALNLERWRWLPPGPTARYLLVRLDDYTLDLVEEGQVVLRMKVVAGKAQWRTPVFHSTLTQIVLNPYWNVPPSIAREEILPALRQNPALLEERGFMVVSGAGEQARVVPPDSLDLQAWSDDEWPYTFIQVPGPDNPLGRMKFLLPNPYNVYLHDTPNRELFSREVRDFSHGCIRLEKSMELAVRLLADNPEWTRTRLREIVQAGETRQVRLPNALPVYFGYWTARVDEAGLVHFNPDLYGADARLEAVWDR